MFSENKALHLGQIYRLVEQFELISRTDLAKLSGFAPASITNLTKILIDNHFILERAVQSSNSKGRPAVGLSVSCFYWQLLCITISTQKIEVSLCEMNGIQIYTQDYTLNSDNYPVLEHYISDIVRLFCQTELINPAQLLAVSVSVVGKINAAKKQIIQLGHTPISCSIEPHLSSMFDCPILLSEHFQLWLLAESSVGSLISQRNVIFLQLDDTVNLSVLMQGNLLHKHAMNVDKMVMPRFSALSDEIFPELDQIHRYQLVNQVSFPAIVKLIDRYLPNSCVTTQEKIDWFCQKIDENQPLAFLILEHISDNLAYMIMNLVNIFSSEIIMLNSPLLKVKEPFFQKISERLQQNLRQEDLNLHLVTSQFEWNSPLIACSAIKQGVYEGNLIKHSIKAPFIG